MPREKDARVRARVGMRPADFHVRACIENAKGRERERGGRLKREKRREGKGTRCGTRGRREGNGGEGARREEWEIIKMAARATYSTSYSSASPPPPPPRLSPFLRRYSSTLSELAARHGAARKPPSGNAVRYNGSGLYRDSFANR